MRIPAIFGVDTRQITKVIREHGRLLAQMACACDSSQEAKFSDSNARHLVAEVSTKKKSLVEKLASDEDWEGKPSKCVMEIVV